ncbi:glycosyltransferase [Fusobacterium sp. IOR10]|uniref:glycosyltransferase n=1 Tax=Fusobacterium sp. IOR10 TaxID=2665157 RepID=UPI0013CFD705|nr:glycosyltransferase [Fusobacterium sp. IOR10]
MKNIGFCIDSLEMGGAEKLFVDIIKSLHKTKKYKIYLLTTLKSDSYFFNEIKDMVTYHYLLTKEEKDNFKLNKNLINTFKSSLLKRKRYKLFSKEVDTVIDFLDGDFYKYIKTEKNKSKIVWLHSNYKDLVLRKKIDKKINHYNKVIVITNSMYEEISVKKEMENKELFMIYNMFDFNKLDRFLKEEVEEQFKKEKYFLTVCRLDESQKDVTTLIKSYSEYKGDEKLYIIGDGKDKKSLEELVMKLELSQRVIFLGEKKNPFKYMKNAKAFILSSKGEGFGLVLVEALYAGTKVISSNCEYGPREILLNGDVGELFPVGNKEKLLEKLYLITKKNYDNEKIKKSLERFEGKIIIKEIERTIR